MLYVDAVVRLGTNSRMVTVILRDTFDSPPEMILVDERAGRQFRQLCEADKKREEEAEEEKSARKRRR